MAKKPSNLWLVSFLLVLLSAIEVVTAAWLVDRVCGFLVTGVVTFIIAMIVKEMAQAEDAEE